uniref:Uncharacterized protein LOC114339186 n=1 Tax=Diabrotica virgifera virgifera TaxID=50390 RepID=A0A6P7GPB6_DIAVI
MAFRKRSLRILDLSLSDVPKSLNTDPRLQKGEDKEPLPHHEHSDICGQDAAIKSASVAEENQSKQSSVVSANLYLSDSDDSIKDKDYQPDSDTDSDESGSRFPVPLSAFPEGVPSTSNAIVTIWQITVGARPKTYV